MKLITANLLNRFWKNGIKPIKTAIDNHTSAKASASVLGNVKLTDSAAVTDSTGLALPATEKNASVKGTLANQISVLNMDLDKKAPKSHTHDDRYYTESEINVLLNQKLSMEGGTINQNLAVKGNMSCNSYFTSTPGATLKIETSGFINLQTAYSAQVRNQNDTGWAAISASSFVQQSSQRYKKNITDMSEKRAQGILKLRPVVYDYINEEDGVNCIGLIAEEVNEIEKYPIMYNENGEPEGIDYSRLVPMLIKMVQIQEDRIAALENRY